MLFQGRCTALPCPAAYHAELGCAALCRAVMFDVLVSRLACGVSWTAGHQQAVMQKLVISSAALEWALLRCCVPYSCV